MQIPLQISFRHMSASEVLETRIRNEAERLEKFYDHITSCRIMVEAPHAHHHKGKLYHVRIDLTVPRGELVVSRDHHDEHAHEDVYVAIRDAFYKMQRQLEDYVARRRGHEKIHEIPPHGRISKLYPEEDYGVIETFDNREIYFHKNSVLDVDFGKLEEGKEVRFVEELGEKGPQASTVRLVGKHHIVG